MKVLITGAGGFIGRQLVRDRVRRGDQVVALDVHEFEAPEGVETCVADIGDEVHLRALLRDTEVVFHLAAAHLDQSTPESEYERVNIAATRQLVTWAHEAGARRFVHCSSVGVYGHVENPPVPEDGPKNPGNMYERTKLDGERAVLSEGEKLGIEVVSLRPAWVFGASCPRTQRFCRTIAKGRFFFFGAGGNLRHPIHITDVLEAFHRATDQGPSGKIYNIAGPRTLSLAELSAAVANALGVKAPGLKIPYWIGWCAALAAEIVFSVLPKTAPITRRSLVFFSNVNAYSIDAAEKYLGFTPQVDVDAGMQRVAEALGGKQGVLSGEQPDVDADQLTDTPASAGATT